jgi:hypothetical protein
MRVRGAVIVEYSLLLVLFAVPVMMGVAAGGAAMLRDYQKVRQTIVESGP